jgi:hypothetical protein
LKNEPKTYTGEKMASSKNDAGKIGYLQYKRLKLDLYFTSYIKKSTPKGSKFLT